MNTKQDSEKIQKLGILFYGCRLGGILFLLGGAKDLFFDSSSGRFAELERDWPIYLVGAVLIGIGQWGIGHYREEFQAFDGKVNWKPKGNWLGNILLPILLLVGAFYYGVSSGSSIGDVLFNLLFFAAVAIFAVTMMAKFGEKNKSSDEAS